MHSGEDRDAVINVVVEFNLVLAHVGAQESADVLDDASSEGNRERKEQGVEFWPVEAFADVGAGGDDGDSCSVVAVDGVGHGLPRSLAQAAAQDMRSGAQLFKA